MTKLFNLLILTISLAILSMAFTPNQKNYTITGTVTSADGEPLIAANVLIKDSTKGVVTDFDGKFSIESKTKCATLVVTYIGFTPLEIEACTNRKNHIKLDNNEVVLDEVVVISYGSTGAYEAKSKRAEKRVEKERKRSYRKSDAAIMYDIVEEAPVPTSYASEISPETYESVAIETPGASSGLAKKVAPASVSVKAGQLTAAEWNDLKNWEDWTTTVSEDLNTYHTQWNMAQTERYEVFVRNDNGKILPNSQVQLMTSKGEILWETLTDNAGKAELWANTDEKSSLIINATYGDQTDQLETVKNFKAGINAIELNVECPEVDGVEIVFVVDATGSMSDEITYLQAELKDVIQRTEKEMDVRTGSVFYRDHGDEYLFRTQFLSSNNTNTLDFINKQSAGGGGDTPEAVEDALEEAIYKMNWSENSVSRIMFFLLDAPPHQTEEIKAQMLKLTKVAAEKGIRVVPIMASDAQGDTEYLMRSLATATNGTFLFLTNDSGIGNDHAEPSVGPYTPSFLNELMLKVIKNMTAFEACDIPQEQEVEVQGNPTMKAACFPNPTTDYVNVSLQNEADRMEVIDMNGQLIWKQENLSIGITTVGLQNLQAGTYYLRFISGDDFESVKIVKAKG